MENLKKPQNDTYRDKEASLVTETAEENTEEYEIGAIHAFWKAGDLSYQLWPQQEPIYDTIRNYTPSKVNEVVLLCARQFGKSHLGTILAVEDCIINPNRCVLIIGPTQKQTVAIVGPRLKEITKNAPPGLVHPCKSESKWVIGDSELVIGGMDLNSSAQRGKTLQNVYVEEIVDSKPDLYTEALRSDIGPALTHSDGGKIFFLTTPPRVPDHPFLVETAPKAELGGALFKYTIYDNKKISPEQFRRCAELAGCRLNERGEITEKSIDWLREYECIVVRDARVTVIPEFIEAKHVHPVGLPPSFNAEIWIDWGGVRDKTVALLSAYSFHENRLWIIDERVFGNNTPTEDIVREIKQMEAPHREQIVYRWADCPGQLYVDLRARGYDVRQVPKDDWQAGINNLNVMFRLNQIGITPNCRFLITSLNSGQFNDNKTDFQRSEILGHLDAVAAMIYCARGHSRDNPYPISYDGHYAFSRKPNDAPQSIAEGIQPKVFSKHMRKFGAFKP